MKVISRGVIHKQRMGGVRIVVKDVDFVRYTFERMVAAFARQDVPVEGVLFVEHVSYTQELGNEVLLGFRESEAFGPVISFSKGGADAEHFARYFSPPNLIMAPIDETWARALLASTSNGELAVFDLTALDLTARVVVQASPMDVQVDPTGLRAYVTAVT